MLMWVQRNVALLAIFCCALSACTKVDPSLMQNLQLQSTDPAAPPMSFNILGVSGNLDVVADIDLFSTTSPVVSWTAAGGAQSYNVKILDIMTDAVVCEATSTGTSHYFAGCMLNDGSSYKLKIAATNANGTTQATNDEMSFQVDNTAPSVVQVDSPVSPASWKEGDIVTIRVLFSEPVFYSGTDAKLMLNSETSRYASISSASGDGSLYFTYTVALGDAASPLAYLDANSLVLNSTVIKDGHGNLATTTLPAIGATNALDSLAAVVVDGTTPSVTININRTSPTNSTIADISGNCSDTGSGLWGGSVYLCIKTGLSCVDAEDFAEAVTCDSGTYHYEWNIPMSGEYNIAVWAEDEVGHQNIQSLSPFTVDFEAPAAFNISGVTGGADSTVNAYFSGAGDPTFHWTLPSGADYIQYTIDDLGGGVFDYCSGSVAPADDNATATGCSLSEGSYQVRAYAFDNAGNSTPAANNSFNFTVDRTAPVITLGVPSATAVNFSSAFLTIQVAGASAYLGTGEVTIDYTGTAACTVGTSGTIGAQNFAFLNCTGDGTVSLSAPEGMETDAAGNGSAAVGPRTFTVDNTPPGAFSVSGVLGGADSSVDDLFQGSSGPQVNWSAAVEASSYTVSVRNAADSADVCGAVTTASVSYTFTGCTLTNGSAYIAKVKANDSVNNSTTAANFKFYAISSPLTWSVAALYPTNGANWNDYVHFDGATSNDAGDVACNTSSSVNYNSCIHGGEKRKVTTIFPSCNDLSIATVEDWFDWDCEVRGGFATFISNRLKSGKGLTQLIDFSGPSFLPNSVTVKYHGFDVGNTPSVAWWSNPFESVAASSSTTSLGTTKKIYVIASNQSGYGFNIAADKVALVTAPSASYTYNENMTANCSTAGTVSSSGSRAIICAGSRKFLWIEGQYYGYGGAPANTAQQGIYFYSVGHSRIHKVYTQNFSPSAAGAIHFTGGSNKNYISNTTARNPTYVGLRLEASHSNLITDHVVNSPTNSPAVYFISANNNIVKKMDLDNLTSQPANYGLFLASGSSANEFEDVRMSSFSTYSLYIGSSVNNNRFRSIQITNNLSTSYASVLLTGNSYFNSLDSISVSNGAADAFQIDSSTNNTFTRIVSINNAGHGFQFGSAGASNNVISNATFVNHPSGKNGIHVVPAAPDNIFNQILSINNSKGIYLDGAWGTLISQYAGHNAFGDPATSFSGGIELTSNANDESAVNRFKGSLLMASSTAGENCTVPALGYVGLSTCDTQTSLEGGTFYPGISGIANSIVGKYWDAAFGTLLSFDDWVQPLSPYRGWGRSGLVFPDSTTAQRSRCSSGTCAVWDVRIRASDTVLRNHSGRGINENYNQAFVEGQTCPTAVSGSTGVIDWAGRQFLANAIEHPTEGSGNHDGLCESNETCIYQPNFGAYLGEGALTNACSFQNGAISGVIMKAYTVNGAIGF